MQLLQMISRRLLPSHFHHLRAGWVVVGVILLGSILLEIVWYLAVQKRRYPWGELLCSVGVYLLRVPEKLLRPLMVAPVAYLLWSHRLATIPVTSAWGVLLLFLATELAYYCMHRAAHEIRWMWASHAVHHSPEHIHLASAFRLGATEVLSGNWLFYLPLYVIGFNPMAVGAMLGVNLLYQYWLHTDLVGRLGPLEWVLNTPSHHRVHHASNPEYLDRNYGGILIIWDRLFGTFAEEQPNTPLTYGLVHPVGTLNPIRVIFHEWIAMARDFSRAPSWRLRLRELFGAPGAGMSHGSVNNGSVNNGGVNNGGANNGGANNGGTNNGGTNVPRPLLAANSVPSPAR